MILTKASLVQKVISVKIKTFSQYDKSLVAYQISWIYNLSHFTI